MGKIKPLRVGVIGAGSCSEEIYLKAYKVGEAIAQRHAVLICGGRGGVMEAAARGAIEAGGITVGILPGESAAEANSYILIPIVTDLGHARNVIVVQSSEVVIAIAGGYGTLSEIALALKTGKKVVGLHTWQKIPGIEHFDSVEDAIDAAFSSLSR